MKVKLLLILNLFFFTQKLQAQLNHFVYIESENKQPFYAIIDKNVFNAANGGFLIIPQLKNQLYKLQIGFPLNRFNEQVFSVNINGLDHGFMLKQDLNNKWQLVNLLTYNVINEGELLNTDLEKQSLDSPKLLTSEKQSTIKRTKSDITIDGLSEIYIDKSNGLADTIKLLIPNLPKQLKPINATKDCEIATEEDFRKLRLNMASTSTELNMLTIATKSVKEKCFSTEQVKNLGVLFLNQQNRLQFFLSVKKQIYDVQNFSTLENQFSDPNLTIQFRKSQ